MISHSLSIYQVELLGSNAPSAKPDGVRPEHVSGPSGTIKDDLEDDLPF